MAALNGYLALGTITDAGVFTEIAGASGYARQAISLSASGDGDVSNDAAIAFPANSGATWAKFDALAIYSAVTGGSPLLAWRAPAMGHAGLLPTAVHRIGAGAIQLDFPSVKSSLGTLVSLAGDFSWSPSGLTSSSTGVAAAIVPNNRLAIIGNSIPGQDNLDTTSSAGFTKWLGNGVAQWANYLLGGRFQIVARAGIGGQTTAQILARFQADALSSSPRYVWMLECGINDPANDVAHTTTIANFKSMFALCRASGATPIVSSLPPSTSINSANRANAYAKVNNFLRDYARETGEIILIDNDWLYLDTTATYPHPLAASTDSIVHPNARGAFLWGRRAAQILDPIIPKVPVFSNAANVTWSTDAEKFITNPFQRGTAGTKGTNTTGNVSDSWTVAVNTTPADPGAVVASKVARTDAPGEWMQLAFTGATGYTAQDTGILANTAAVALPTDVVAGDTVYAVAEINMLAGQTNFRNVAFRLRSGSVWSEAMRYETSVQYVSLGEDWPAGVLTTPDMIVPSGSTGLNVYLRFMAGAANAAFTAQIGRVQIRKRTVW